MKHGKRIFAALVAAGALSVGIAGPASAGWRGSDYSNKSCAAEGSNYTRDNSRASHSTTTANSNEYYIPNYC